VTDSVSEWKRYGWWWRDPEVYQYDPHSHQVLPREKSKVLEWRVETERIAWGYEVVRRFHSPNDWPSYIDLPYEAILFLHRVLPESKLDWLQIPFPKIWDFSKAPPEPGWFSADGYRWNLMVPNNKLCEHFQNLIEHARKKAGITPPRGNPGRKCKPISWRGPELIDLKRNQQKFSEADRVTLRRVQKRADCAKPFVERALKLAQTFEKMCADEEKLELSTNVDFRPPVARRLRRKQNDA
jgi:hypothetical protein